VNNNITAEEITVSRTIGKSAVIGQMERQYPVRKRALLSMFGGDYWNSIQYFILAPHILMGVTLSMMKMLCRMRQLRKCLLLKIIDTIE